MKTIAELTAEEKYDIVTNAFILYLAERGHTKECISETMAEYCEKAHILYFAHEKEHIAIRLVELMEVDRVEKGGKKVQRQDGIKRDSITGDILQ